MAEQMIPVICVAHVPAAVLSEVLKTAYTNITDCPPSLVLLPESSALADPNFGTDATQPPVANITTYPFLSNSIASLVTHLRENAPDFISSYHFLVADAQTLEDNSLLFVDAGYDKTAPPDQAKTVRLSAQQANAVPVAIAIGTMGIEEVIALADNDGVFRGGPRAAPRRGQPAPRMQLGGSN